MERGGEMQQLEDREHDETPLENPVNDSTCPSQPLSKRAQKKLLKQQKFEAKKAEKRAMIKDQKKREKEQRRKEWDEKLANLSEEEKLKLIESRRGVRNDRMEKRSEERERKIERLTKAKEHGQNIVIDLEFSHLMTSTEINSLVQQIMYCYAVNGRCASPGHLWLTGCKGDMETQLKRLPGFDKWIIEKESGSYIVALQIQKENLVYLTADAETTLDDLDPKHIYIVGGLVERKRWKGITTRKAREQGIQAARLPIGNYLKMSCSQVLTVNQVVEILLKYLETRDWKASFFKVIPQRKRCEADADENGRVEDKDSENDNSLGSQKTLKKSEEDPGENEREVEINKREKEDDTSGETGD